MDDPTTVAMRRHATTLLRLCRRAMKDARWRREQGLDPAKREDEAAALEFGSLALRTWISERDRWPA